MLINCDVIVIFPILYQFGAIREPDSRRIICKIYIFIKNNLLFLQKLDTELKISNTALTLLLWVKVLFLPKCADFFAKNAAKIRELWHWKIYIVKLHVRVYLRTKFQAFTIILTKFR